MEEMEGKPSKIPESMPGNLQKYYQFNDVNVFVYSKPFRKSNVKSDNEFKVTRYTKSFISFIHYLNQKHHNNYHRNTTD